MSDESPVNPRMLVVEDRAAQLADDLKPLQPGLASHLADAASGSQGMCDAHVPMLKEALERVEHVAPDLAPHARKILTALNDLPAAIGRRGCVWIGRDSKTGLHSAHWEQGNQWLELGPENASLDQALAWAHRRTDDVRGPFDPGA
jgi:hypothetical protein